MFTKRAVYTLSDPTALNQPVLSNSVFLDQGLFIDANEVRTVISSIKTAKSNKTLKTADKVIDGYDEDFDLEAEIKEHPDSLFVKCFAIKADEANDNGDYFPKTELKKAYGTFVGVPVFTNHKNDDVNQARGKVVHSWWDEDRNGIMVIMRVDSVAYPQLARSIKEKYTTSTSMGCFLGDNRVLLANGTYCPIEDMQTGDLVITHKGNIKPVVNVQRHLDKENAEILHIAIDGIKDTIDTTKDHPFYVPLAQNICSCGCNKPITSYTNRHGCFSKYQKKQLLGHYQKTSVKISDIRDNYEFGWKRADELNVGDLVCLPRLKSSKSDITIDEAKLIGIFLAEGSYIKHKGVRTEIEFNFNIDEKNTLVETTKTLLSIVFNPKNKIKQYLRPDRNTINIRLAGKEIANWFYKNCGEYSHSKKIADYLLEQNDDILNHLIGAFISGDGHLHKGSSQKQNYTITTSSKSLRDQFSTILTKLGVKHSTCAIINGKSATLRLAAGGEARIANDGSVNLRKPWYHIQIGQNGSLKLSDNALHKNMTTSPKGKFGYITDDFILTKIKSISKSFNTEPVYTLEVKDDHSYVVEGVAVKNCKVAGACCSVCHNYATVASEFCSHIKDQKTRKFSGKAECKYHKNGTEDECPICGCKKGETKTNTIKESENHKIHEYNYGIQFIENSMVVQPACHDCGVTEIIDVNKFLKKVADIQRRLPGLLKSAQSQPLACTDKSCITVFNDEHVKTLTDTLDIVVAEADKIKQSADIATLEGSIKSLMKHAGQAELNKLNQALDLLSEVSKSMLEQKAQLDLEFLSDLIQVVADLQTTIDELTEQGYGRLQSPNGEQAAPPAPGEPGAAPGQPSATPQPPQPAAGPVQYATPGIAKSVVGPLAHKTKRFEFEKIAKIKGKSLNTDNSFRLKLNMLHNRTINFRKKMS